MNTKLISLFTISLLYFSKDSLSQEASGKIINGKTVTIQKTAIPRVIIRISGSSTGTIANEEGNFQIRVHDGDTLQFEALPYKTLIVPVSDLLFDTNYIVLTEQIYELGQINILAARWQDFKFEMMNKTIDPVDKDILEIEGLPDPYTKLVPVSLVGSPISFLYEYFKKENIRKRKQKRWNQTYENTYIKIEKKP